jgi:hypothetical protein
MNRIFRISTNHHNIYKLLSYSVLSFRSAFRRILGDYYQFLVQKIIITTKVSLLGNFAIQ